MEFHLSSFKAERWFCESVALSTPANLENSAVVTGLEKFSFIPIPKKGNAKECSNYHAIALISHTSKIILRILQARLQHYRNHELPDVQAGFRKDRGTRDQIANICWIIKKARQFHKNIFFCLWGCRIVWCILTSQYLVSLLPVSIIHVSDIFLVGFWSWEIWFIMWGCRGWGWQAAGTWVSVSREMVGFPAPIGWLGASQSICTQ